MGLKDTLSTYKDWFLYWNIGRALRGCESVLDLGCGECSPLLYVKKSFTSVGVDGYGPSILKSKKLRIHDRYIQSNLLFVGDKIKPKSFDAVILLDVVEHFSKKDGLKIIHLAETIAKKKIVVLTPNGFYRQDEIGGNPYQVHKSGWSLSDLTTCGYIVRGLRGLKFIRGEYATIYRKPWVFWAALAFVTEPVLYFWPAASYHYFAVKRIFHE